MQSNSSDEIALHEAQAPPRVSIILALVAFAQSLCLRAIGFYSVAVRLCIGQMTSGTSGPPTESSAPHSGSGAFVKITPPDSGRKVGCAWVASPAQSSKPHATPMPLQCY
jgi:hypothetical protein